MVLAAGARLGPYEIVAPLGAGGMGEVYKARDTRLDRVVALKVLRRDKTADPERKRRFMQEARAASALNHPGRHTRRARQGSGLRGGKADRARPCLRGGDAHPGVRAYGNRHGDRNRDLSSTIRRCRLV